MTLIVSVTNQDGIVIAGDRRTADSVLNADGVAVVENVPRKVGLIGSRYVYGTSGLAYFDDKFTTEQIESLDGWAPLGRPSKRNFGLSTETRGVRAAAVRGQRRLHDAFARAPDGAPGGGGFLVLMAGFNRSGIGRVFQFPVAASSPVPDESGIKERGSTRVPTLFWMGCWDAAEHVLLRERLRGYQYVQAITAKVSPSLLRYAIPLAKLSLDEAVLLAAAVVQEAVDSKEFPEITGGVDVVVATREGVRALPQRDRYPLLKDLPFLVE